MARINLVIADTDSYYVEGLVRFLSENYGQELQISYFTESIYLYSYLNGKDTNTDILLISPALMADTFDFDSLKLVLVLSDGRFESAFEGCRVINKYQMGDKLAGSILDAYAGKYPDEVHISSGEKQSKIVAVFSPVGGVGKSTVAVALASRLSSKGHKVLYLNLETIQTTPVFFECPNEKTLSDILYFVRDRNKALAVKLEGVKQVDMYSNVHYISPPESISDMEETKAEELHQLLQQLKSMNKYSVVVIDMSCGMDEKNLAVLGCSDEILVLYDQSFSSKVRMRSFLRELKLRDSKFQDKLGDKCVLVLNKYVSAGNLVDEDSIDGKSVGYRLPKTQSLMYRRDNRYVVNLNNDFGEVISAISDSL